MVLIDWVTNESMFSSLMTVNIRVELLQVCLLYTHSSSSIYSSSCHLVLKLCLIQVLLLQIYFLYQSGTGEVILEAGRSLRITTDPSYEQNSSDQVLYVDYPNIVHVLEVGSKIFIDDGLLSLVVKNKGELCTECLLRFLRSYTS